MTDQTVPTPDFYPRRIGRFIERFTGMGIPFRGSVIEHPILKLELKRARWLRPDARTRLHRMLGRRISWLVIFMLVVIILDLLKLWQRFEHYFATNSYYYYSGDLPSGYMLLGAILLSLLFVIVGDFYYLIRSLKAITPERESGHWDMVRLLPVPPKVILDAKIGALQLQAWRILLLEYTPRFYLVISFPIYLMLTSLRYISFYSYDFSYRIFTLDNLLSLLILTVMTLLYLAEAGWRMRTLTAIGVAISSRSRNLTSNFVAGFFALVGLHAGQFLCLYIPITAMDRLSRRLVYNDYYGTIPYYIRSYLVLTFTTALIGLLNYGFLWGLRRVAYNYALRRAFRDV